MISTRIFNTPAWRWRNPLEELNQMRKQMLRFSEELEKGMNRGRWAGVFPLINMAEDKESYFLCAELPGIKAEDLDISITGNRLAISGERKIPSENKSAKYHRREREAGKFSRMLSLPNEVDASKVEAKITDGVLTVTLPKAETAKPRQITVG